MGKESRERPSFLSSIHVYNNNGTQRDRVVLRARLRRDFVSKQQWFWRFGDEWCRGCRGAPHGGESRIIIGTDFDASETSDDDAVVVVVLERRRNPPSHSRRADVERIPTEGSDESGDGERGEGEGDAAGEARANGSGSERETRVGRRLLLLLLRRKR